MISYPCITFTNVVNAEYPQTSDIERTLVGIKIAGHSDVVVEALLSALLQLHINSRLNTWLQWIGHKQLQDETRKVLGFWCYLY